MPIGLLAASDLRHGDKVLTPTMRILEVDRIESRNDGASTEIYWVNDPGSTILSSRYRVNLMTKSAGGDGRDVEDITVSRRELADMLDGELGR